MPENIKSEVGERIRECAKIAGSGDELARTSGVPRRTLENYLSGHSEPKASGLVAIARAANVSLDWLLTGEGPMHQDADAVAVAPGMSDRRAAYVESVDQPGFVLVPRYDVEASAGPGAFAETEDVIDFMAFREDWVRRTLRADPASLVLITAVGDSMEPAIRAGDLLLVDRSVDRILDDAIYVLAISGRLIVKRVQQFFNGAVTIKSDNDSYVDETLSPGDVEQVRVAGRVRWIGRLI